MAGILSLRYPGRVAKEVFPQGLSLPRRLARARRAGGALAALAAALAGWFAMGRAGTEAAVLSAAAVVAAGDLAWRFRAGRLRAAFLRTLEGGADAALARGQALLLAGDRAGAERLLGDLSSARPRDPEAHLYWALALREQGDLPGSERALRKALRLDLGRRWTAEILALLRQGKVLRGDVGKDNT